MRHYSLKVLFVLFVLFVGGAWLVFYRHTAKNSESIDLKLTESGTQTEDIPPLEEGEYPIHRNITATVFWVGENESTDNDFIHNRSSAWIEDWEKTFGGVDTPNSRNGWLPAGFTPNENPFYFALPYSDYDNKGKIKKNVTKIHWYDGPIPTGGSIIKNQWVKISRLGKSVYAQWEDVGPFEEDDVDYVFGDQPPKQTAGIDLSPATAQFLGIDGEGQVSWQFVSPESIPDGPWAEILTQSGPDYR